MKLVLYVYCKKTIEIAKENLVKRIFKLCLGSKKENDHKTLYVDYQEGVQSSYHYYKLVNSLYSIRRFISIDGTMLYCCLFCDIIQFVITVSFLLFCAFIIYRFILLSSKNIKGPNFYCGKQIYNFFWKV